MTVVRRTWSFFKEVFSKFARDSCTIKAQSLSYITVLSLVPLSALSFSIFSQFSVFQSLENKVKEFIFSNFLPSSSARIQAYLSEFVENTTVLSIFGITVLVVTSVFFLDAVERTFNDIWGVRERRPWLRRFASFWSFITLAPLFLALSIYVSSFVGRHISIEGFPILKWLSYHLVSVFIAWIAFFLGYYLLPYTDVDAKSAFKGSLFTAVLWEIVKKGFDWYITNMTNFGKVYGSLGLIPVFLFWVYLVWLIILLGGEVTYLLEWPSGKKPGTPYFSLKLLFMLADHFEKGGGPLKVKELVKNCRLERKKINQLLETFSARGWIVGADGGYILAVPPDRIELSEVLEVVGALNLEVPPEEKDRLSRVIARLTEELKGKVEEGFEGLTLKEALSWTA